MANPTLSDVHIQAALTQLSIAYQQSAPPIALRVFPGVPVAKQSDKYYIWSKADMWRDDAAKRAPGTDFDRIDISLSNDTYYSEQYGLEAKLPDEILANQDAAVDLETTTAMTLVNKLNLKMDVAWASAYMSASAGWTAGTASAKWSTTAGTPIADVTTATRLIADALGDTQGYRMVGVCGRIVEQRLKVNAEIRDVLKYTQAATPMAVQAQLAATLGLDELIVAGRQYNTAKKGATASYSAVFDDDLLVLAVPTSPGLMTAAAGYTFQWDEGGRGTLYNERYRDEPKKSDILRAVGHWGFEQTGAALGVFFADCVD